jgi:hypothetical protein
LTKTDQDQLISPSPKDYLHRRFQGQLTPLLDFYGQQHDIAYFATSAVGYLSSSQVNFERGAIINADRWKPINTALPFFWLFNKIEYAQVEKMRTFFRDPTRNYDKYPTG